MPASFMIVPINFPAKPDLNDPHNALQYTTQQLKHWDMAPDNLMKLTTAKINVALTSSGIKTKSNFRKNHSKSVRRGLSETEALAALTTNPAKEFGQSKRLGKVAPGFIANLVVTDGNYFNETSKVNSVWIDGNEYEVLPDPIVDANGNWLLREGDNNWTLAIKDGKGELKSEDLMNSILDKTRVIKGVEKATALVYDDETKSFIVKATSGYELKDFTDLKLTKNEAHARYEEDAEEVSEDVFIIRDTKG